MLHLDRLGRAAGAYHQRGVVVGGEPRRGDGDAALAAIDPGRRGHAALRGTREAGGHARRKPQHARRLMIHARPLANVADGLARHGLLAGDQARERHTVAPHVHQRPARRGIRQADVGQRLLIHAHVVGERAVEHAHLADGASVDELLEPLPLRVAAVHERLHEEHVAFLDDREHLLELGRVHRNGLLAQDVLACPCRFHRPFGVQRVGRGDVDRIHLGIGEQFLVGAIGFRDVVLLGERLSLLQAPRPHGQRRRLLRRVQPLRKSAGDVASRQHAPVQTLHLSSFLLRSVHQSPANRTR